MMSGKQAKIDTEARNERLVRRVLAALTSNMEARQKHSSFGQVSIKFAWQGGEITTATVNEETIYKPDE